MKERIKAFLKEQKAIAIDLQKWVTDQSIPLEERWEVFLQSNLGHRAEGEFPGVDWSKHDLHDHFYMARHNTQSVSSILELALENDLFIEDGETLFKEYCLSRFINEITNDW